MRRALLVLLLGLASAEARADTVLSGQLVIDDAWCKAHGFVPPAPCAVTGTYRLAPDYYGNGIIVRRGNLSFHDFKLVGHPELPPARWPEECPGSAYCLNAFGISGDPDVRYDYAGLSFHRVEIQGFSGVGLGLPPGATGVVVSKLRLARVWLGLATSGQLWDPAQRTMVARLTSGARIRDVACWDLWSIPNKGPSDCVHLTGLSGSTITDLTAFGPTMIVGLKLSGPQYGTRVERYRGNGVNIQAEVSQIFAPFYTERRYDVSFVNSDLVRSYAGDVGRQQIILQSSGPVDLSMQGGSVRNSRDDAGAWRPAAGAQLARWPAGTPTLRATGATFEGFQVPAYGAAWGACEKPRWPGNPPRSYLCKADSECAPPAVPEPIGPCVPSTGAAQLQGPDAKVWPSESYFKQMNAFVESIPIGRLQ